MYEYTQILVRRRDDDGVVVTIGLWKASPTRRNPIPVKRPWEHVYYLKSPTTQEEVFAALNLALRNLAGPRP